MVKGGYEISRGGADGKYSKGDENQVDIEDSNGIETAGGKKDRSRKNSE